MLSMSADISDSVIDLHLVNGEETRADSGIEHGRELMKFAEAVASGKEDLLTECRAALLAAAGPAVLVDAAGVAANFQRMVRIADSTGIPVDTLSGALSRDAREELKLDRFQSAQNTPPVTLKQRVQGVFIRLVAPRILRKAANKASQHNPG